MYWEWFLALLPLDGPGGAHHLLPAVRIDGARSYLPFNLTLINNLLTTTTTRALPFCRDQLYAVVRMIISSS
jgi:hypothetical protein